jgi:hypothetical protein
MSDAIAAALIYCQSTYIPAKGEENQIVTVSTVKKRAKSDGAQSAPPANKSAAPIVMVKLPNSGTLDARGFLKAKNAVKGNDRDGIIAAIAAYIGYDITQPFGIQDSAATDQARRELRPVVAGKVPFSRGSLASAQGFVAASKMRCEPDHNARHFANLRARERHAVDTMLDHEKAARDAKSLQERTLYAGLALVERERLIQIRKDMM